jgi:hypothetical protein
MVAAEWPSRDPGDRVRWLVRAGRRRSQARAAAQLLRELQATAPSRSARGGGAVRRRGPAKRQAQLLSRVHQLLRT